MLRKIINAIVWGWIVLGVIGCNGGHTEIKVAPKGYIMAEDGTFVPPSFYDMTDTGVDSQE